MSTEMDMVRWGEAVDATIGADAGNSRAQRYEYVAMDLGDASQEQLNAWGSRGWDLVSVVTVKNKPRAYLKRPILVSG